MGDDGKPLRARKTHRGFATSSTVTDEETSVDLRPPYAASSGTPPSGLPRGRGGDASVPLVDIEYVREHGSPSLIQGPWRSTEIWTHNRIYALDAGQRCISVLDRASGSEDPSNKILGSVLIGGQKRERSGAVVEVSHPLPRRGSAAVFERRVGKRISFSETSPVTRVVFRLRVVTLVPDSPVPSWDDITGPGVRT